MAGEVINSWQACLGDDLEYLVIPSSREPDGVLNFKTFGEAKRYWLSYFDGRIDQWKATKKRFSKLKRDDLLLEWERVQFGDPGVIPVAEKPTPVSDLPIRKPCGVCQKCSIADGLEFRTCPYQVDMNSDEVFQCNCCEGCQTDCANDV